MQVAVVCQEPVLAASVEAVVAAADGSVHRVATAGQLPAAWRAVTAVVCDLAAAEHLAGMPLAAGPALIVVATAATVGDAWRLAAGLRASAVVALPEGEHLLLEALLAAPRLRPGRAKVVATIGGGGGAGASSLAVVLAGEAARSGHPTTLIDLDPLAGGLELLVGAERSSGLRWPDLVAKPDLIDESLPGRLPAAGDLRLLSWDRRSPPAALDPALLAGVLAAAEPAGLVVIDLPRFLVTETLLAGCDEALLVCSRQVRAAGAAGVLAATCAGLAGRLRLVAGGAAAPEITTGDLAAFAELPVAATLAVEPRVARQAAIGELHRLPARSPARRVARRLVTDLAPGVRPAA